MALASSHVCQNNEQTRTVPRKQTQAVVCVSVGKCQENNGRK